jgi:hypothetical protein
LEQSILSIDQQRWVSAIMKLTELTNKGKLTWQKHSESPAADFMATMPNLESTVRYTTSYEGQRFFVRVRPNHNTNTLGFFAPLPLNRFGQEPSITFEVWKGSTKLFSISGLTLLSALADTIRFRVDHTEEEALSAIENIAL